MIFNDLYIITKNDKADTTGGDLKHLETRRFVVSVSDGSSENLTSVQRCLRSLNLPTKMSAKKSLVTSQMAFLQVGMCEITLER